MYARRKMDARPAPRLPEWPRPARQGLAEGASGFIGLVFGLGLSALVLLNGDDPGGTASHIARAAAFGSTASLPGVLALLGRRRPSLYLAAGVVGIPLSFISLAGVTLPLLIPSSMALVAY